MIRRFQRGQLFVNLQENVLCEFFSDMEIAYFPPNKRVNPFLVFLDEDSKRTFVSIQSPLN